MLLVLYFVRVRRKQGRWQQGAHWFASDHAGTVWLALETVKQPAACGDAALTGPGQEARLVGLHLNIGRSE